MKDSSSKPKKRHEDIKSTIKVILKRYSFIVWVPTLLYIFYLIGNTKFVAYLCDTDIEVMSKQTAFVKIMCGGLLCFTLALLIILILICIMGLGLGITEILKKKNLREDLKEFFKDLKELLIEGIKFLFIKLPKKIVTRIKKEPDLFRKALEKEKSKQTKKE